MSEEQKAELEVVAIYQKRFAAILEDPREAWRKRIEREIAELSNNPCY